MSADGPTNMQTMLMPMNAEMLRCCLCYVKHEDVCPWWMPSQWRGLSPALFQHIFRALAVELQDYGAVR